MSPVANVHPCRFAALFFFLAGCALAQSINGWVSSGADITNNRWASWETLINSSNAGSLVQKWAFTTQNDVSATPAVDAGANAVYFPDWSGTIYKVDATTGALIWSNTMSGYGLPLGVRSRTTPALYEGTLIIGASAPLSAGLSAGAWVLCLDAATGARRWMMQPDSNPNAIMTSSPVVYNGVVYVGVSSSEEAESQPTFRGSVLAVSAATGAVLWRTYMIPPGYSGAPIWSSTAAIDPARNQIYVTTGNNYLVPSSVQACELAAGDNSSKILACQASNNYEDSIVAMDLTTGAIKWGRKCSVADAWIAGCSTGSPSCPSPAGNDLDFGSGANMFTAIINGQATDLVGAGQKTGFYWALNPVTGAVVWKQKIGPGGILGGIEWGTATDGQRIYAAISNSTRSNYNLQPSGVSWNGGSWAALDPATGRIIWQVADPGIDPVKPWLPALSLGPVSVANGVVYCASMSGYMYALDAANGNTLWSFLAAGSVNAGPSIVNGSIYWGSGYHNFPQSRPVGTASNTVYAFTVPPVASLSSSQLGFGRQLVGITSSQQSVTLSNTGGSALTVAGIAASGDFTESDTCAGSVAPGASCTITVRFAPQQAGWRAGALTVTDNAPDSPQILPLGGLGVPHASYFDSGN